MRSDGREGRGLGRRKHKVIWYLWSGTSNRNVPTSVAFTVLFWLAATKTRDLLLSLDPTTPSLSQSTGLSVQLSSSCLCLWLGDDGPPSCRPCPTPLCDTEPPSASSPSTRSSVSWGAGATHLHGGAGNLLQRALAFLG